MTDWLPLLAAFGLGSVTTAVVQWFLALHLAIRERQYQERKEAYIGLFGAWADQTNDGFSPRSSLAVGHWVDRAKLVASPEVFTELQEWDNSEPGSPERLAVMAALRKSMRDDLCSI